MSLIKNNLPFNAATNVAVRNHGCLQTLVYSNHLIIKFIPPFFVSLLNQNLIEFWQHFSAQMFLISGVLGMYSVF